jgi:hypothetical protein
MKFLPPWMTNKYLLASIFFLVWLLFFDHNDLALQYKRSRELGELKEKAGWHREKIKETRKEVDALRVNASSMEKVAREKYMMKKDNEDLFVIEEK